MRRIAAEFLPQVPTGDIRPIGAGLINDTFFVEPGYVLQRINHNIFKDVDGLQRNITAVTDHLRAKLAAAGEADTDRKVLRFIPARDGRMYYFDGDNYWRMMVYVAGSMTRDEVTVGSSEMAGEAFGRFQAMLSDIEEPLIETIPDFHNIELRLRQLRDAIAADPVGRAAGVKDLCDEIFADADEMTLAERMHRAGLLPKRACHCDTKVNNMLFDAATGQFLCVIDLDTVMPSYVFSDYGDFLRTAASTVAEDDPDTSRVHFRRDIFEAFTRGYLRGAGSFLTRPEIENLSYAVALFPYMQAVRFLTDYINGDTYYKTAYADHNLVRAHNQMALYRRVKAVRGDLQAFINALAGI